MRSMHRSSSSSTARRRSAGPARGSAAVIVALVVGLTAPSSGVTGVALAVDDVLESTEADRIGLGLTVYGGGFAVVSEERRVELPPEEQVVRFLDVPEAVEPASLILAAADVEILEQGYRYDLLEPGRLIEEFVGREITLVFRETEGGDTVVRRQRAVLLSKEGGGVWRIGDRIVVGPPTSTYELDRLPAGLELRPTLVWRLRSDGGTRRLSATYVTGRIGWSADYALVVGDDGETASLTGWATVDNRSGVAYRNVALELVAGDVRRAGAGPRQRGVEAMAMRAAAAPDLQESSFGAYHLYTLGRRVTIRDRETQQFRLVGGEGIPVRERYRVESSAATFRRRQGGPREQPVLYSVIFDNREAAGLGEPLPAGTVRVLRADGGRHRLLGENRIGHTPVDEEVSLELGTAFDVVAERRQTEYSRISDHVWESAYEVQVRNHRERAVEVTVREHFGGDWEILDASGTFDRVDAFTADFVLDVPADGATVLTYRVRVRDR